MHREVERKYEVPARFHLPDLADVPGVAAVDKPVEHHLSATYYDTPQLRLAAHRVTLRRRTGGTDDGWHVKRPAGTDARTETRLPLGRKELGRKELGRKDLGGKGLGHKEFERKELGHKEESVPAELADSVRALSRGDALRPVARVRTRRVEHPLRGRDGRVLALIAEDEVISEALGEKAVLQRWRELEVELVDGRAELLDRIERALRGAGATRSGSGSKLAHALADRLPAAASPPKRGRGERALHDYLEAQRDAIIANDPAVRKGDPEAVHDMRVALRRLRSSLHTFRPALDTARSEPLRDELKWLGQVLGAVRDGDVLAEKLHAAVAAEPAELVVGPVAARITERLAAQTAPARTELTEALNGRRYAALLDELDALVDTPLRRPLATSRLRRLARHALLRADKRLADADRQYTSWGADRDHRLHDARKSYKQARYALEVLKPIDGKPAGRLATQLTRLQDVLGVHQDVTVLSSLLRDFGMRAQADGENAFTYGLLHARLHGQDDTSLSADLPGARRRAQSRKLRRFLA